MSSEKEQSRDRFQLAGRRASVNIKAGGQSYPLETRLHLIHYNSNILTNILYLTPSSKKQRGGGWLAGFDPIANKVCSLNSKLEVVTAINCLLDSSEYDEILDSDIDMPLCRSLVQRINRDSGEEAEESLIKLIDILNINMSTNEMAMSNEFPVKHIDHSATIERDLFSFKLTIGDQELTDGLLSLLRIGGQREDTLLLKLDIKATSNLPKADYNDDTKLFIDVGQGMETIFGGITSESQCSSDDKLTIICRSYALALKESIIPGLMMRTFGGAEKIYYILRGAGWQPDKLSIDGLARNKKRFCLILTPVTNIKADKPFGIGDVTFSRLEDEHKDAMKLLNPDANPNFPKLDEDVIWAKTYVSAPHFYEAQVSGIDKINMALDLLSDVKSDSKPFHYSDEGYIPVSWRRSDRFSRVTREPWIYIQDLTTKECILTNTEYVIDVRKLEVTQSILSRLEKGTDKLQILFQKPWDELNGREKSLVYALHWLHRARDEGTDVDKLIYLWNAIEFISSTAKPYRLFSKGETNEIKKLAHGSISGNDAKKDQKKERITEIIAMLNNPSLLSQLKQLIESENIGVSEEEWERIRESRDKRNAIIHGRTNVVFDENEVNKLSFIISKIISGLSFNL